VYPTVIAKRSTTRRAPIDDQRRQSWAGSSSKRTLWGFFVPSDFDSLPRGIAFVQRAQAVHRPIPARATDHVRRERAQPRAAQEQVPGSSIRRANSSAARRLVTSSPSRRFATTSAESTWRSDPLRTLHASSQRPFPNASIFTHATAEERRARPLASAALDVTACSREQLLEVNTPDQITTTSTASASGAQSAAGRGGRSLHALLRQTSAAAA
jgi:hypothetical protein